MTPQRASNEIQSQLLDSLDCCIFWHYWFSKLLCMEICGEWFLPSLICVGVWGGTLGYWVWLWFLWCVLCAWDFWPEWYLGIWMIWSTIRLSSLLKGSWVYGLVNTSRVGLGGYWVRWLEILSAWILQLPCDSRGGCSGFCDWFGNSLTYKNSTGARVNPWGTSTW